MSKNNKLIFLNIILQFMIEVLGRDVILTPKEGLHLDGKIMFYTGTSNSTMDNPIGEVVPWEQTLKHLTFVTLFPHKAIANKSKIDDYKKFLGSLYTKLNDQQFSRFGDKVTVAFGRLEEIANGTYRFVEGSCTDICNKEKIKAIWHIQKIRHRDPNREFRYEIKFGITPVGAIEQGAYKNYILQENTATKYFILRDDDYPESFERIINYGGTTFREGRFNHYVSSSENDKISFPKDLNDVPLKPQSTFIHGLYQLVKPPLMYPHMLNMGEMMHRFVPRMTSKIELYPSLKHFNNWNMANHVNNNPMNNLNSGIKRYQEEYKNHPSLLQNYGFDRRFTQHIPDKPILLHNLDDNRLVRGVIVQDPNPTFTSPSMSVPQSNAGEYYIRLKQMDIPAPQKIVFPEDSQTEQISDDKPIVLPEYTESSEMYRTPFKQSEQMTTESIRYSEPDPLYLNDKNALELMVTQPVKTLKSNVTQSIYEDGVQQSTTDNALKESTRINIQLNPILAKDYVNNTTKEIKHSYDLGAVLPETVADPPEAPSSPVLATATPNNNTVSITPPTPRLRSRYLKTTFGKKVQTIYGSESGIQKRLLQTNSTETYVNGKQKKAISSQNAISQPHKLDKAVAVLTQSSVSKSISYKVGSNGIEIPIITSDDKDNSTTLK